MHAWKEKKRGISSEQPQSQDPSMMSGSHLNVQPWVHTCSAPEAQMSQEEIAVGD